MKTEQLTYKDLLSLAYMGHTVKDHNGNKLTWVKLTTLSNKNDTEVFNVIITPITHISNNYQITPK